jgi:hypothetical protein
MPVPKGTRKADKDIAVLKEKFLKYYEKVPIQKYAAAFIKRSENTVSEWKAADDKFRDAIEEARAIFVQTNIMKTKADWKLERMLRQDFGQSVDVTSGGEKITPIFGGNAVINKLSPTEKDE